MSLDDAIINEEEQDPPIVCDECAEHLENTEPHPILGWKMLVFVCKTCKKPYCSHLESVKGSLECVDCAEKKVE